MTSVKEWIDDKIKNGDIDYFKYNEFSNIVEVGRGGFGKVSKADSTSMGVEVALKSFYGKSKIRENDIGKLNELVKELKLLRMVHVHPNINRFLGITKDYNEDYIMILEYANEKDLRDYLENNFASLEWNNKIQMALDITRGLKYLHSKNIIHRDLHSKNILVNRGKLLIADLGLSKQITEVTTNSMANGMGICGYVEPQCFKDPGYKRDKKSDIYSLGVLFWEISSGRPPFLNFDPFLIGFQIRDGRRETPVENTPLEYQQLYQKCWDKVPDLRPDINEVHEMLIELKSKFEPVEFQVTQDLDSLDINNQYSYSNNLQMNFIVDENLNKNQDAQEWFNMKYSQKKSSINELKISDRDFDSPLKIDGFTKLEIIDLKIIKLTSLEVINCSQLTKIDLSELTSNLEISYCSELIEVELSKCQIKSLSVIDCPKLTKLDCSHNELTELDASNLIELNCSSNKIKYLNLNLCPEITTLNCSDNELNVLEISNCSKLEVLNCHNNQLTSLDISNCLKLKNYPEKSVNFITTSNPNLIMINEDEEVENLLIDKENNKTQKWFNKNIISYYKQKDQKWFNKKYSQRIKESISKLEISDEDFDNSLKIDGFMRLETIYLTNFKLASLKISNCSQITKISLSELSSNLEIRRCTKLNEVKLSKCRIKSLFVNDCPKLTKLDCSNSGLIELDISNLTKLNCSSNKIKYLNLNLCPEITTLNCSNNELTVLEISNCSELEVLNCRNNQLTSLDISNCPKLKKFITTSNSNLIISKKRKAARNLLIVGRTGGGKSTLANALSDSDEFKESGYSISETNNFQKKVFQWNGTDYRVVDTIGVGITNMLTKKDALYKFVEGIYSMPEGISQVLIVFNGRFTAEELEMFRLFEEVIFESGIHKYTTIVRTKFDQFQIKEECEKDTNRLLEEAEKIAEIVKSCSIVYVDNLSTNIVPDEDYEIGMRLITKRREKSRFILLNHLEEACNKENYKFKTWGKLRVEIDDYMKKIESDKEAAEEIEEIEKAIRSSF